MSSLSIASERPLVLDPCPDETSFAPAAGSSVQGAVFNFSNSIIGAGAIGLGGAIAVSGGLASVCCILFFALLTKLSLDMLIILTVQTSGAKNSYEELGRIAYGTVGRLSVLVSKTLYSFGCLVAYIVVIKDNFAGAFRHLLYGDIYVSLASVDLEHSDREGESSTTLLQGADDTSEPWMYTLLEKEGLVAFVLSAAVIMPLCLLRDMTPLAKFSVVSVFSMLAIVFIVIYIFAANPGGEVRLDGGSVFENWFEVRSGLLESLGSFVFTFVSQHTVHLAYESLDQRARTVDNWKRVSLFSMLISTAVSLSVGLFVYMTFWQKTESDVFQMYPSLHAIDVAKILLCFTMMLTFPLPFFTCREMIILVISDWCKGSPPPDQALDMRKSLLVEEFGVAEEGDMTELVLSGSVALGDRERPHNWWLKPGEDRQLIGIFHIFFTLVLWGVTTGLAIVAPSLGDVLDLVGCATGTVIAFILPALFSFRLAGYTHLSAFILMVGGAVGFVGTFFSVKKLISDSL